MHVLCHKKLHKCYSTYRIDFTCCYEMFAVLGIIIINKSKLVLLYNMWKYMYKEIQYNYYTFIIEF